MTRPSYDEYFMSLAHAASTMGTCSRRKVGAVAVRDRRVLATGFNGSPAGTHHCEHEGYPRKENLCGRCGHPAVCPPFHDMLVSAKVDYHEFQPVLDPDLIIVNGRPSCSNAVHAEANVIAYAASYGVALRGSTIYTNTYPCHGCARQMVSCGVVEVVFDADYNNDPLVELLCKEAKMVLRRFVSSTKFDDVDAVLFDSALKLLFRDLGVQNLADAQARIRELKEREVISAATAPTEWVNEYSGAWRCKRCGGYFTTMDKCNDCGTKRPEKTPPPPSILMCECTHHEGNHHPLDRSGRCSFCGCLGFKAL